MRTLGAWVSALCRVVLTVGFFLVTRILFRVYLDCPTPFPRPARTYFALMHKRDIDPPLILPHLLFKSGRRALLRDVHFGMRSDAFSRGFLARIVGHPAWFARLLRPLNVGPLLRSWGVRPVLGLQLRPAEDWIRAAIGELGDIPIGEALAPAFIHALAVRQNIAATTLAAQPLSSLLQWRYFYSLQRFIGTSFFAESQRREMERYAVGAVKAQLAELAAWLQGGGAILGAPEGLLSPDGRISRISGGYHRIMQAAPSGTQVVPIVVIYDFMTRGRTRAFIAIAPPIAYQAASPVKARDAALRQAWLRSATFTCTQIGSEVLMRRSQTEGAPFTTAQFAASVGDLALHLARAGRKVDANLLTPRSCQWRAQQFLAYAARQGALHQAPAGAWVARPLGASVQAHPGEVGFAQQPFAYAWAEFHDMLDGDEVLMATVLNRSDSVAGGCP